MWNGSGWNSMVWLVVVCAIFLFCMVVCGMVLGEIQLSGWWLCLCFFLVVYGCVMVPGGIELSGWWLFLCFFCLCMVVYGMVLTGIRLSDTQ